MSDMAKLVAAADAIRQHLKLTVIIVHHERYRRDRARGHTSLRGTVDVLIGITKDQSGLITVIVQEMRDDDQPPPLACRLERREIACDDESANIFSMVIEACDLTSSAGKVNPTSDAVWTSSPKRSQLVRPSTELKKPFPVGALPLAASG
jgi:hypothetical protein